ncbi:MAG: hypothetical protein AUJ12_09660 [Alphaproteobacteria bacterium CG1_02_46_17]|nr:MAG: hypothetical protein AUJ12_09660 [Alphaproteobacteria bacterium CG1_02_46_17]
MRSPHREIFLDLDKKDPLLQRLYDRRGDAVEFRLSSYFGMLAGESSPELMSVTPFLYKEFKSKNPSPDWFEGEEPKRFSDIRTIVDENISRKITFPVLWDRLGPAIGVKKGWKDPELFDFAVRQQYDVILTRDIRQDSEDEDLTAIALRHFREIKNSSSRRVRNRFPLIVHLDVPENASPKTIRHVIERCSAEVRQAVINRKTPLVKISREEGFVDGRLLLAPEEWRPVDPLEKIVSHRDMNRMAISAQIKHHQRSRCLEVA